MFNINADTISEMISGLYLRAVEENLRLDNALKPIPTMEDIQYFQDHKYEIEADSAYKVDYCILSHQLRERRRAELKRNRKK